MNTTSFCIHEEIYVGQLYLTPPLISSLPYKQAEEQMWFGLEVFRATVTWAC